MPGLPTDLLALLAACRACPADDTPRLVLADWLDDHPDGVQDAAARAALVRVQIELSRPSADNARVRELKAIEQQILAAHFDRWYGELPAIQRAFRNLRAEQGPISYSSEICPPTFVRGMVTLRLGREDLADERLRAWFASDVAPWIETATVRVADLAELNALVVPPELAPYLGVSFQIGGRAVLTLFNPNPTDRPVSKNRCRQLLRSPNFPLVRSLKVVGDAVAVGFLEMFRKANVSGVQFLDISGAELTDEHASELAATPLVNLSSLNVSANAIGPDGVAALADSPHLRRLVSLTAFRNRFGDAGLEALARSPLAGSLNSILLQNNGIGGRGIQAMCASPLMERLVGPQLNLSMNRIPDAGAVALAGCEHLANFRELIMRENAIGPAGAAALAASPFVANLAYLDLYHNQIGDRGAEALAESKYLTKLRDLSLRDNGISATGADRLRERYGDRVKA